MNSITHVLRAIVPTAGDLPAPSPVWDFVGTGLGMTLYNAAWTFLLIGGGIGVIVGGFLIIFGKVGTHQKTLMAGLITVACSVVGVALGAGAGALVSFGATVQL